LYSKTPYLGNHCYVTNREKYNCIRKRRCKEISEKLKQRSGFPGPLNEALAQHQTPAVSDGLLINAIYLSIALQHFGGPWPLFSFLIYTQSVVTFGWGISPSQSRYIYAE
jgi:hypothetical protein